MTRTKILTLVLLKKAPPPKKLENLSAHPQNNYNLFSHTVK